MPLLDDGSSPDNEGSVVAAVQRAANAVAGQRAGEDLATQTGMAAETDGSFLTDLLVALFEHISFDF